MILYVPELFPSHCSVHFLTSPKPNHNFQGQHGMVLVGMETSLWTLDSMDRLRKDEIFELFYGYLVTGILMLPIAFPVRRSRD